MSDIELSWINSSMGANLLRIYLIVNFIIFLILVYKLSRKSKHNLFGHKTFVIIYLVSAKIIEVIIITDFVSFLGKERNWDFISSTDFINSRVDIFLIYQFWFWLFPIVNILIHYYLMRRRTKLN